MKRDVYSELLEWKHSYRRKPLILMGARQVGKTYLAKEFGAREYEQLITLNFEEEPSLKSLFTGSLSPENLISKIEIFFKTNITPHTLLFFDEIQECPQALTSLKFFCEKAPERHLIAAGSLLGVKLTSSSIPVGKVSFLTVYPLNFFEFLSAAGNEQLAHHLKQHDSSQPLEGAFHEELLSQLKFYFYIGGMPEAVLEYVTTKNIQNIRPIHKEILKTYELDFAKHASKADAQKISEVFHSIPEQLGKENKKFIFSKIKKSARSRDYETSIQWLKDAGLIIKVGNLTTPKLPLKAYAKNDFFKVYFLDVGLLATMVDLDSRTIVGGDALFQEFKGSFTENFVIEELHQKFPDGLYYWTSEGLAEVDIVFQKENGIFPLEIKSGINLKSRSLRVYAEKYRPEKALRTSSRNFKRDGLFHNYPLYAVSLV